MTPSRREFTEVLRHLVEFSTTLRVNRRGVFISCKKKTNKQKKMKFVVALLICFLGDNGDNSADDDDDEHDYDNDN